MIRKIALYAARIIALFMILVVVSSTQVLAQRAPGAGVTQTTARADAAIQVSTSASSAATITITPNAGEYVYVTEVDVSNCAGAAAVTAAAVTTLTTTNLNGSPVWTLGSGTTAGACQPTIQAIYPTGLKAATSGTAVTFVLPTFATNQTVRVNVAWYSGP